VIRPLATKVTRSSLGFRRWAAQLLEQELWCLGRDVASKGNILLSLGFCRYRSPNDDREASLYTSQTPDGNVLWLWGFGVAYTEPGHGSVFIRRYDFAPRITTAESFLGVHDVDSMPGLLRPSSHRDYAKLRRQLQGLCTCIAQYEHWLAENYGRAWREQCLVKRNKPNIVEASEIASAWERAAKICKTLNSSTLADRFGPWAGLLHSLRSQCEMTLQPCAVTRPSTKVLT